MVRDEFSCRWIMRGYAETTIKFNSKRFREVEWDYK